MSTGHDPSELARQLVTFNEFRYLTAYPDVAEAVRQGLFASGRQHYIRHGFAEGRQPAPVSRTASATQPPATLGAAAIEARFGRANESMLAEKAELESRMRAAPADRDLRGAYFGLLRQISRAHFGAFFAILPEIPTPLMFRSGSSDFANLNQVFFEPSPIQCQCFRPGHIQLRNSLPAHHRRSRRLLRLHGSLFRQPLSGGEDHRGRAIRSQFRHAARQHGRLRQHRSPARRRLAGAGAVNQGRGPLRRLGAVFQGRAGREYSRPDHS